MPGGRPQLKPLDYKTIRSMNADQLQAYIDRAAKVMNNRMYRLEKMHTASSEYTLEILRYNAAYGSSAKQRIPDNPAQAKRFTSHVPVEKGHIAPTMAALRKKANILSRAVGAPSTTIRGQNEIRTKQINSFMDHFDFDMDEEQRGQVFEYLEKLRARQSEGQLEDVSSDQIIRIFNDIYKKQVKSPFVSFKAFAEFAEKTIEEGRPLESTIAQHLEGSRGGGRMRWVASSETWKELKS